MGHAFFIRSLVGILVLSGCLLHADQVTAQALRELPPYLRDISDEVGALPDSEGRALATLIANVQRETGVRIVIVIAETTAPESIEDYTTRLSNYWLARRPPAQGEERIFFVLDLKDGSVRLATGEKMASLVEKVSKSDFMSDLLPMFKRGEYYRALKRVVERLSAIIKQRSSGSAATRPFKT